MKDKNNGGGSSREVDFSDEELADLRQEHQHFSVFAKVLHREVGPQKLSDHLARIWRPRGTVGVVTLENEFFQLKFSDPVDLEEAMRGVPWTIDGRYISLRPWVPNFKPSSALITHVKVWIRLPELPIEYYDKIALSRIAEAVGKFAGVIDLFTENKKRCKYARLSVEIDLNLPLVSHVKLHDGGLMQPIQYEGLEVVCYQCGRVGHFKEECSYVSSSSDTYGTWLHSPPRRRQQQQSPSWPYQNVDAGTGVSAWGSGFQTLEQENILRNFPKIPSMNPAPIDHLKEDYSYVITESTHLHEASSSTSNNHGPWVHVPPRRQQPQPRPPPDLYQNVDTGSRLFESGSRFQVLEQENDLRLLDDYEHNFPKISAMNPAEHLRAGEGTSSRGKNIVTNTHKRPNNVPSDSTQLPRVEESSTSAYNGRPLNSTILTDFYSVNSSNQSTDPPKLHLNPHPQQGNTKKGIIEFHSQIAQRATQEREINREPVEIVEQSTQGSPTVFTMASEISSFHIAINTSPLPNGNGNKYHTSFVPTDFDPCYGSRKLLVWSCRGAGDPNVIGAIKGLCEKHKPSVILLFETRINGSVAKNVINELGFSGFLCVDPVGSIGGVWILWHKEVEDIAISSATSHQILATVGILHEDAALLDSVMDLTKFD